MEEELLFEVVAPKLGIDFCIRNMWKRYYFFKHPTIRNYKFWWLCFELEISKNKGEK